ncbi:stabilizer of axonemal microtubules 1 [Strongylocentrotus purpuratus]|uniref:Stabilizer of axonemal microtubules 2 n=1 Tax=Strongylocentrotus purpuratus TaxID=7668 RepID=A0A7M7TGN3_STRPU|nr:stabilizer of axonemal microtubules 1 [Strongylocentrotus purpuratus]|eukprot:XP_787867.1 PREDICTED: protein FAM154A [Strongylocentrotus purpuratus]
MPASRSIGTAGSIDTDILNIEFPKFTCICEICDCGRHKHHHNCKRKRRPAGADRPCDLSHYQQTFTAYPNAQRQLPLIPPATPRDPNPPRMVFDTTQRHDFIPTGEITKPQKVKPIENYQPTKAPLDGETVYKVTYPGHTQFPQISQARPPSHKDYRERSAKFDQRTTNKEEYRAWVAKPSVAFGELPSFAGSILYPGDKQELQSMTQQDFVERPINKSEMIRSGVGSNIQVREGKFDHNTIHKMTYKDMGPGHTAKNARPSNQYPSAARRAKFDGVTQSRKDFPGYQSQPLPQKPCTPPPVTIRLSMDSKIDFVTENTHEFQGHDVLSNPKRATMKKDSDTYNPPTIKFATDSSNKVDYRPIEDKSAYLQPNRRPHTQGGARSAKFYDQTTNNRFFRNWGAKPRIRYGDFHEAKIYIKPRGKMEVESWNSSTYKSLPLDEPTPNYKPHDEPVERSGEQDFTTIHKSTYKGQRPKMCKSQLYLLQQEMRRRKALRDRQMKEGAAGNIGLQAVGRTALSGTV